MTLHALARYDEHRAKLDDLISRWGDQWPFEVAHVYAFTGIADAAFR